MVGPSGRSPMKDVMIATSEKTDIKGPMRAADPSALPALSRKAYA